MVQATKSKSKLLKRDFLWIFIILISPLCIYLYQLFPMRVAYYENNYFKLESNYYDDIQAMIYMISTKVVFVIIYSIWYVTSKNWWKSVILFPLFFSIYQLILVVNDEVEYIDNYQELLYTIVLSIPVIFGLTFLSKKLDYYEQSHNLKETVDKEIDDLVLDISKFQSNKFKSLKEEVKTLRKQKTKQRKEDYLIELIKLRDKLYNM